MDIFNQSSSDFLEGVWTGLVRKSLMGGKMTRKDYFSLPLGYSHSESDIQFVVKALKRGIMVNNRR